jgi:amino acid transporter
VVFLNKKKINLNLIGSLLLCAGIALLVIAIPLRYYGKGNPILIIAGMALILFSVITNMIYINKSKKETYAL